MKAGHLNNGEHAWVGRGDATKERGILHMRCLCNSSVWFFAFLRLHLQNDRQTGSSSFYRPRRQQARIILRTPPKKSSTAARMPHTTLSPGHRSNSELFSGRGRPSYSTESGVDGRTSKMWTAKVSPISTTRRVFLSSQGEE